MARPPLQDALVLLIAGNGSSEELLVWVVSLMFHIDLMARYMRDIETRRFYNVATDAGKQALLAILAHYKGAIVNLIFLFNDLLDMDLQFTKNLDNVRVSIILTGRKMS